MTASEFAALLHAKRIGRGKWLAKCPAHGDKRPSLSIAEGRKHPVVFKCMSQGCTQDEVLRAMGLTWKNILGERPSTPELSQRLKDERRLRQLEERERECIVNQYFYDQKRFRYWRKAEEGVRRELMTLRNRLYPEDQVLRETREAEFFGGVGS